MLANGVVRVKMRWTRIFLTGKEDSREGLFHGCGEADFYLRPSESLMEVVA